MTHTPKHSRLTRMWRAMMGLGREDGNATIEFAILFPFFLMAFLSIFELAMLMTRYMMFDRAMDMTVRQIRISENRAFTPDQVKTLLCANTVILNNHCMSGVRLEMVRLDPADSWSFSYNDADCREQPANVAPIRDFTTGTPNDVLLIRGCMQMEPLFPTMALGNFLIRNSSDDKLYMMVTSALSVEPI